jgi:hypothetical protein
LGSFWLCGVSAPGTGKVPQAQLLRVAASGSVDGACGRRRARGFQPGFEGPMCVRRVQTTEYTGSFSRSLHSPGADADPFFTHHGLPGDYGCPLLR